MANDTEALIEKFCANTVLSAKLLYDHGLYGQMLVVLYSSIDSMGLLDAPPTQAGASGESFKTWVKTYLLSLGSFEFTDIDFWAARCSVLHTFTSESDLSIKGKAREIQYFSGSMDSPMGQAFVVATRQIDDGKHVPANIEETYLAFLRGIEVFGKALAAKCRNDAVYGSRVRKLLQRFSL
jgi:hypothetical protein